MPLVEFFFVGQCKNSSMKALEADYFFRIKKYIPAKLIFISDAKEKEMIQKIDPRSFLVILDEKGEGFSTKKLALKFEKIFQSGVKKISFVVGGAYGITEKIREKAQWSLALSALTLPHELARVLFLEQFYRVLTILKGEKYHHD